MSNDFQINSYILNNQIKPSITPLVNGGYVVVWANYGQGGTTMDIYGQRFDENQNKLGNEFQVNSFTINDQNNPSVSWLSGGGFVAIWQSYNQGGSGWWIFGQRYDANGNKQGGEFKVSANAYGDPIGPSVSGLSNGGFVVIWVIPNGRVCTSYSYYRSMVMGQLYDSSGNKFGGEFVAYSTTPLDGGCYVSTGNYVKSASVSGFSNFVVVWDTSYGGGDTNVYGQMFGIAGNTIGSSFLVNTYTTNPQLYPSITMLRSGGFIGGFIIAWQSYGEDSAGWGIFGQRYDVNRNAMGYEFQVNTYTQGDQSYPFISQLLDGEFIITWQSFGQDGSGWGIYAQQYGANGVQIGNEFQVNSFTNGDQINAVASGLTNNKYVVAWNSLKQAGAGYGLYINSYGFWPTLSPIYSSTNSPIFSPTPSPTLGPMNFPTFIPTTISPTELPTLVPTTINPTPLPTFAPTTKSPTLSPTILPTAAPTTSPTSVPITKSPTYVPTSSPTFVPTTKNPTSLPTVLPTLVPTTKSPTYAPTASPAFVPTTQNPTPSPITLPTLAPTTSPTGVSITSAPTLDPTTNVPTSRPTELQAFVPTSFPTTIPTDTPAYRPTVSPTNSPTSTPTTLVPTFLPTEQPTTIFPTQNAKPASEMAFVSTNAKGTAFIDLRNKIYDKEDESDHLKIKIMTLPVFGNLHDQNGSTAKISKLYSPAELYYIANILAGYDNFSYTAIDTGYLESNQSTVSIAITAVSTLPITPAPTTMNTSPMNFGFISNTNGKNHSFLDFRNYIGDNEDADVNNLKIKIKNLPSFGKLYVENTTANYQGLYMPNELKYATTDYSKKYDVFYYSVVDSGGLESASPAKVEIKIQQLSNILVNAGFEGGLANWNRQCTSFAALNVVNIDANNIVLANRSDSDNLCILWQTLPSSFSNKTNILQLRYKTADVTSIEFDILGKNLPLSGIYLRHHINLVANDIWNVTPEYQFDATKDVDLANSILAIRIVGNDIGDLHLDDISLFPSVLERHVASSNLLSLIAIPGTVLLVALPIFLLIKSCLYNNAIKEAEKANQAVAYLEQKYGPVNNIVDNGIKQIVEDALKKAMASSYRVLDKAKALQEIDKANVGGAVNIINRHSLYSRISHNKLMSLNKINQGPDHQIVPVDDYKFPEDPPPPYDHPAGAAMHVPIGIALTAQKIDLVSLLASNVSFNYYDDGIKAKTAWVGSKDAFLIYDHNDNKQVDFAKELVLTKWSKTATTDFEALKEVFDSNKDNKFDAKDAEFNKFMLWQDKNQDGISQSDELVSLLEARLLQIDFNTEQTIHDEFFGKQQEMRIAGISWEGGHQTLSYDLGLETECSAK